MKKHDTVDMRKKAVKKKKRNYVYAPDVDKWLREKAREEGCYPAQVLDRELRARMVTRKMERDMLHPLNSHPPFKGRPLT